jgi:hypothetical protein
MTTGQDLVVGESRGAEDTTELVGQSPEDDPTAPFNGRMIFLVRPFGGSRGPRNSLDGIQGVGNHAGTGVVGIGGEVIQNVRGSIGVRGHGGAGLKGSGNPDGTGGPGVQGEGGRGDKVTNGIGGTGLLGLGGDLHGPGVVGVCHSRVPPADSLTLVAGVVGKGGCGVKGYGDNEAGVLGESERWHGVFGDNSNTPPVNSGERTAGVHGRTVRGIGTAGVVALDPNKTANNAVGIYGEAPFVGFGPADTGFRGSAGVFIGPVWVFGPFTVVSSWPKKIAMPFPDGSYRSLYCSESPEPWFEDFGEGRTKRGVARVRVRSDFLNAIDPAGYQVFLTQYGESQGLYVAERTAEAFTVRECNGGRSSIPFGYRLVAKPRNMRARRFEKVTPPFEPPAAPGSASKEPARRRGSQK